MTEKSDSGHSAPAEPAHPYMHPGPVGPQDDPQTVITPARPALFAAGRVELAGAGSTVWNRLFAPSSVEKTAADSEGIRLGYFVIEARIGVGGMGAVFRARDTRLQRTVALKVLSPSQSHDPSSVQRFQNEARAAARLDHENVSRVHYIGEDQGLHFIAFEYVTGTNVRDLIRQVGRFSPSDAVNYTLQIASALNHTSAAGVVHRDIKPSNVIVTPGDRAKLVDLGLARKENTESVADLTEAGTTLGTFDYISPEQAKDPRNVDVRSDIYSLGCTLYHMLTGEPPYPEGTVLQKLLDHQGKDPPNPALKNRQVSSDLAAIVQKMMASDPNRRYATPDHLIRDLMVVAGTMGLRGVNPEGLVWMTSRPASARFWERNLGWMATATILLAIVFTLQLKPELANRLEGLDGPKSQAAATDNDTAESNRLNAKSEAFAPAETVPLQNGATSGRGPLVAASEDPSNPLPGPEAPSVRDSFPENELPRPPANPETGASVTTTVPQRSPDQLTDSNRVKPASEGARGATVPTKPFAVSSEDDETTKYFTTLQAACLEAADGSDIELQFNGTRNVVEKRIRISKKRLTIRPAKGFRPILQFEPIEIPGGGWQTRMITVNDGTLRLHQVDIQLSVPYDVRGESDDDRIALFSVEDAEQVRLEGVNVTIENLSDQPVAVLELREPAGQPMDDVKMRGDLEITDPLELEISGCFVRGDADLIVLQQAAPSVCDISNSVIALRGRLFHVLGTKNQLPDGARNRLLMNHVTCLLGGPLIDVDTGDLPRQVNLIHVSSARNNIFAIDPRSGQPLVNMEGNTNTEDFRDLLVWAEGERNFYDEIDEFWRIQSAFFEAKTLDFSDWKQYWQTDEETDEVRAYNKSIEWAFEWRNEPFDQLTADDVALDREAVDNPAIAGASDRSDAGANLENPQFPRRLSTVEQ